MLLPALGLSVWGCGQVAHWYYAGVLEYRASLDELPALEGCDEVLDDPLLPDSHWNRRADWPEEPCWGEEAIHRAWTSRSLQDRALRMRVAYGAEPMGIRELPGGPRVYHRLDP